MHVNRSVRVLNEALVVEKVITVLFTIKLVHAQLWQRDALLVVKVSHFGTSNNLGDSLHAGNALRVGLHHVPNGGLFRLRVLLVIKEEGLHGKIGA